MQHNYRSGDLVTIDNEQFIVNYYNYEKCEFEEAFLALKLRKIFSILIGKNRMCRMTEVSVACDSSDFDGYTISVGSDDFGYNKYVSISGLENMKFATEGKFRDFISLMGNN